MALDDLDINGIRTTLAELRQQADELRRHL
jgi:hypothetical protein